MVNAFHGVAGGAECQEYIVLIIVEGDVDPFWCIISKATECAIGMDS